MVSIRTLDPASVPAHLDALAALRVRVFREYPYRYEGSPGYEREYLAHYAGSSDAVVVLAESDGRIVGASTGLPLTDADATSGLPFERAGLDPEAIF